MDVDAFWRHDVVLGDLLELAGFLERLHRFVDLLSDVRSVGRVVDRECLSIRERVRNLEFARLRFLTGGGVDVLTKDRIGSADRQLVDCLIEPLITLHVRGLETVRFVLLRGLLSQLEDV